MPRHMHVRLSARACEYATANHDLTGRGDADVAAEMDSYMSDLVTAPLLCCRIG